MRDMPSRERLFPTDQPVAPAEMIGRRVDVERVSSALSAGQSLRILAPRRTGKTTVCDAALEHLRSDGWYTASVDLMKPAGAAELSQQLTRAVIANRPQLRRALVRARNAWERVSDRVRVQTTVELGDDVRVAFETGLPTRDATAALDAALSLPQRVAESDGRPLALFFDELQELAAPSAPFGDPERLQARMRAVFQRADRVALLFAGSREHAMRQVFHPSAPLGAIGGSYELSEIAPVEWEEGLAGRFAKAGIEADRADVSRLVGLGDGHPRATMLLAAEAFTVARELGKPGLDATTVALAWERARSHDAERCRLLVERIRRLRMARGADLGLRTARAVARGEPPYRTSEHAEQVRRMLDELSDIGVVEQVRRRVWRVPDPLLRAHLLEA
jgi:hypothetical protein